MAKKDKVQPRREVTKRRLARWQRERRRRRIIVAAGLLVVAVILAIIGYGFYATSFAPVREWVTTVGGKVFNADDYVKTLRLYSSSEGSAEAPLLTLEDNELVRQGAITYNIIATDDEVTQRIKDILFPEEEKIDYELYNEMLRSMGISNEEFREAVKTDIFRERLNQYFLVQVPQSAEQVHVEAIMVATEEEAAEVMGNLSEGEDFSSLAAKLGGGDLGWLPRGIMSQEFDEVAFSIEIGEVSDPFLSGGVYYIIKVSEREEREIEEQIREQLAYIVFSSWLEEERDSKVERNPKYNQKNPEYMVNLENLYEWAMDEIG